MNHHNIYVYVHVLNMNIICQWSYDHHYVLAMKIIIIMFIAMIMIFIMFIAMIMIIAMFMVMMTLKIQFPCLGQGWAEFR